MYNTDIIDKLDTMMEYTGVKCIGGKEISWSARRKAQRTSLYYKWFLYLDGKYVDSDQYLHDLSKRWDIKINY